MARQSGAIALADDNRAGERPLKSDSTLTSVVLPAPFGPISPEISPRSRAMLT